MSTFGDLARRARRNDHVSVVGSYGASQILVFLVSLARIPLIVAAAGSRGYGIVLAVSSLLPWLILTTSSLTILARVAISERLGAGDYVGAWTDVLALRRTARHVAYAIACLGIALSVALPWSHILHAGSAASSTTLRLSVLIAATLGASSALGAVTLGVMHAQRRVALTQLFPGVAAVASYVVTLVAWAAHLSLLPFVAATAIAACSPYWFASLWGRRGQAYIKDEAEKDDWTAKAPPTKQPSRVDIRQLITMSGAAAPPLFTTGLDPLVLSVSIGPLAVASYGLANRLGVLVTLLPSALYPLYWATFARLRAAGDLVGIRKLYIKELSITLAGTALLSVCFVLAGPSAARFVSGGKVSAPLLLYSLVGVFGVLSAVQTVTLPVLGGPRTAPKIATYVFASIIPNEALSYVLSKEIGPGGPILASILAASLLLMLCMVMIRREPNAIIAENPKRSPAKTDFAG